MVEVLEAAQLSLRLGRPVPLYELGRQSPSVRSVRPVLTLVRSEAAG